MASIKADFGTFGDDVLSCSICFDIFKDPKVLPCLHTFCQDCIHRHYEIHKLEKRSRLSCPTCRELIPLPPKGVPGFKNDVTVTRTKGLLKDVTKLLECQDESKEEAGACGGGYDADQMQEKREEVRLAVASMQDALVTVRGKLLQMYHVENHVRHTMESEAKENVAPKKEKNWLKRREKKKMKKDEGQLIDMPSLAQLATEQDRLHQSLIEIKSVHTVLEVILQKASPAQFGQVYRKIHKMTRDILPYLEKSSLVHHHQGAVGDGSDMERWLKTYSLPAVNVGKSFPGKPHHAKNVELLYKIGQRGSRQGSFDFPVDATFTPEGTLMVCDKNNNRLQFFDNSGKFMKEFLKDEVKPRRARYNRRDGLIYISDELAECVKVYTPLGQLVRQFGETAFQCPAGMGIDTKGNIVMSDAEKCFVSLNTPNGEFIAKFYYRFLSDKVIPTPYYATSNEDDQLIVSDFRNNIVKVFSNTGQVLFKIEDLKCPRGVCVDPLGNILVAEGDAHRVTMFDPYGKLVCHLLTEDHGLHYPLSVDMNQSGTLIVTQCGFFSPHEVLVYKIY